ncbi:uncharacterized protein LY89DRAFT_764996 [Mollisia scopiformis]|uniref:Uncharacterized protein n=1 Tax=Mollisia scopiformis TaxID=149040 RepID=A0A132B7H7_MOLSC|nr:uncharacterized protein LY89DRAFT_764996 [Mollisia scopiformis]KUJ08203.1 hypothetical protein LY89DRAFT_764996 [Mollisia scopiformis]
MRLTFLIFGLGAIAAIEPHMKRLPIALTSPSAEDQWEWSKMELIPRGCPGGDGATCCPEGTFSCSDGERCICQACGICCGDPCGSGNCWRPLGYQGHDLGSGCINTVPVQPAVLLLALLHGYDFLISVSGFAC